MKALLLPLAVAISLVPWSVVMAQGEARIVRYGQSERSGVTAQVSGPARNYSALASSQAVSALSDVGSPSLYAEPPPLDWFDYTCGTTPWTRGGYEIAIFHDSIDGCLTRAIPASDPEPGRGRTRGPDLDALARAALDRAIALAGLPQLTLAPSELGLTGMETYVWLDDAPGPISASAGAAGVSVTAEASPARFRWDFGDGADLVTAHPGRPWTRSRPGTIEHVYETRGTYDLGVEVLWSARWRIGSGPWRPLGLFATSDSDTLPVRQMQARLVDEDYEG